MFHASSILVICLFAATSCDQKSDASKSSSASPAPSAKAGGDLCELVTAGEAGVLLGGEPSAPQRVTNAMANVCIYPRAGGEVRIMKTTLPDVAAFKPDKNGIGAGAERVSGIGDDAFVLSKAWDVIAFRKGLIQVMVFVNEPQGVADTSREALIDVGHKAAARL